MIDIESYITISREGLVYTIRIKTVSKSNIKEQNIINSIFKSKIESNNPSILLLLSKPRERFDLNKKRGLLYGIVHLNRK